MKRGFTLIELLIVIAIIGVLATIVVVNFSSSRQKSRDAKRLADMKNVQTALDMYLDKNGVYPSPDAAGESWCGGWDSSSDGDFIPVLVSDSWLNTNTKDPKSDLDAGCGNYQYFRYGTGNYGCTAARGAYYVLGVKNMETSTGPYPDSPGWSCPARSWIGEFEWVTGKYEQ